MTNYPKSDASEAGKIKRFDEPELSSQNIISHGHTKDENNKYQQGRYEAQKKYLPTIDFSPTKAEKEEQQFTHTNIGSTGNLLQVSEIKRDGEKVREQLTDLSTGETREFVLARNKDIVERIEDKRIENIPFDSDQDVIPWRQKQIEDRANNMIEQYTKLKDSNDTTGEDIINLDQFGKALIEIANMNDLTEREKALLWDSIMSKRGISYALSEKKQRKDQEKTENNIEFEPNLILLKNGFHDFYHAQLANLPPEDSSRRIYLQEMNKGNKVRGEIPDAQIAANIEASENQVAALRAYKAQGFSGYAMEWNRRFCQS